MYATCLLKFDTNSTPTPTSSDGTDTDVASFRLLDLPDLPDLMKRPTLPNRRQSSCVCRISIEYVIEWYIYIIITYVGMYRIYNRMVYIYYN
jgi:hypothetical protein